MELQTWVTYVRMDRISNLYMDTLLDCVSAESQVKRGKMLQNMPVALLATVCRRQEKRSLECSVRPR